MSQITDEQLAVAWKVFYEAEHRGERIAGMRAALETLSTPPVGAETGEPVAWWWPQGGSVISNAKKKAWDESKLATGMYVPLFAAPPRSDKANGDWVMVPKEPTEAVCRAGMERLGWWVVATPPETEFGSSGIIDPGISEEDATRIRGEMMEEFRALYATIIASLVSQGAGE